LELLNKNCFITGATGGIGKKIAFQLASTGCNLFLTAQKSNELSKLRRKILEENENIEVFYEKGNLEKIQDIQKIIKTCRKKIDSIDMLVNCAGIFPQNFLSKSTLKIFESCFSVNVRAPFIFSKEFSQDMTKKKWGRIINIGSSSAYAGFKETSIYCASKHALLGLSRSLHQELKEKNVRTFCFSPGSVQTKMGRKVKNQHFETFIDPHEIAKIIVQVISYDNEMIIDEVRLDRMVRK